MPHSKSVALSTSSHESQFSSSVVVEKIRLLSKINSCQVHMLEATILDSYANPHLQRLYKKWCWRQLFSVRCCAIYARQQKGIATNRFVILTYFKTVEQYVTLPLSSVMVIIWFGHNKPNFSTLEFGKWSVYQVKYIKCTSFAHLQCKTDKLSEGAH